MKLDALKDLVVVKRSGQRVSFNDSKIAVVIKKAFDAVYENANEENINKVFEKVLNFINKNYKDRKTINVEDIQDIIEKILQSEGYEDVFLSFKEYRDRRAASRKIFNEKQTHKFVKAIEKVEDKLTKEEDSLKPYEVLLKYGKIIFSEYSKSYVLDNKYVRACDEGSIYIHNLDYFSLGIIPRLNLKLSIDIEDDIDDFIVQMINVKKEVNENIGINSLDCILDNFILNKFKKILITFLKEYYSLFGLLEYIGIKKLEEVVNRIDDIQNNYELDILLNEQSKIIFKVAYNNAYNYIDRYVEKIIKRIFNSLKNNLSFSISLSTKTNNTCILIKEKVIDYLVNNDYLDNIVVIFKIVPNLDKDYLEKIGSLILNNKNIGLSFINNSYNIGNNDVEYFSDGNRIYENDNANEYSSTGRMVVAKTSINMARLGFKCHGQNLNEFYNELDKMLEFVKNELILNFETTGNKNKENYEYLFTGNVLGDERLENCQKIRKIIKTGTLNIGLVGLEECIILLEENSENQYNLLLKILEYINEKCKKMIEDTKLNFCIFEPYDKSVRKKLIEFDKAIYGTKKILKNKSEYGLISNAKFVNDYEKLAKVQKLIKGGILIELSININDNKKVIDLIKKLIDVDIGFVKIKVIT